MVHWGSERPVTGARPWQWPRAGSPWPTDWLPSRTPVQTCTHFTDTFYAPFLRCCQLHFWYSYNCKTANFLVIEIFDKTEQEDYRPIFSFPIKDLKIIGNAFNCSQPSHKNNGFDGLRYNCFNYDFEQKGKR